MLHEKPRGPWACAGACAGPGPGPGTGAGACAGIGIGTGAANNKTRKIKRHLWAQLDDSTSTQPRLKIEEMFAPDTPDLGKPDREECDACQGRVMLTEDGFWACTNDPCSRVFTDAIDHSAEWRFYGADDAGGGGDPARCGMPINPLLKESSFGCKILCTSKSSSYAMRKIRQVTQWQSVPYHEKARHEDFERITALAEQGGIPKIIIDDAMRYHKKISEAHSFRGLHRDGIIAATIYIASRRNKFPRNAKEIAAIFRLDNKSATRGCKNATSILNELEYDLTDADKTDLCSTTPTSFLDRYCSRLSLNSELTLLCKFIAKQIERLALIPENTPHSVAAGIVYFVAQECHLNVTKRNVHVVSAISEVTINKCYKKLATYKTQLMPLAIVAKYRE